MAEKRIIAYFMHESEQAAASTQLNDATVTESFVIGQIDEDKIPGLINAGLVVEVLDATPPEPLDELVATVKGTAIPAAGIDRGNDREIGETDVFTVQLNGPLVEEWRYDLAANGARIVELSGPNRYTLRLDPSDFGAIRALEFVVRLRPYMMDNAQPELGPIPKSGATRDHQEMRTFDVRVLEITDIEGVVQWLEERNIAMAGHSGSKVRIHLLTNSEHLVALGRLPAISGIEEFVPPKFYNDHARQIMGLNNGVGASVLNETGAGQIVAVADTGLDDQHPDFQGRIVGLIALGRPNDSSDPNGHGTHVAGSVLGDGAASNGSIQGTAPAATLFFQSIMDANGGLNGLPLNINDLFDEAYQSGARIHNNSWGSDVAGRYTFSSIEVDEFVNEHPDMTIVIAAGNNGSASNSMNVADGTVDWLSIGAPATSKNGLTVGASRSNRTQGGLSTLTWGQAWPDNFPDAPIGGENISGDQESLAAFSGRGPCMDRRIKPDLVAPGTDIVSAKSSRAPIQNFWGTFPGHQSRYAYMGGTSMAAPLVAGCAALVREYYTATRQHDPSAALVKATLINGTRWLTGRDANSEFSKAPNFHQGFGCVHMPWTLPNPSEPDLALKFVDSLSVPNLRFIRTGQRHRLVVETGNTRALRFCLTWSDLPAHALQNNLNLFVQHIPSGKKWIGNADLPLKLRLPDSENNIEIVRIDTPEPGAYLIQIAAGNLLSTNGQDFALVVTGDLQGELEEF